MLYREIGQTDCRVSQLGFGCMRLQAEDGTVEMMNLNKAGDQRRLGDYCHSPVLRMQERV